MGVQDWVEPVGIFQHCHNGSFLQRCHCCMQVVWNNPFKFMLLFLKLLSQMHPIPLSKTPGILLKKKFSKKEIVTCM